MEKDLIQLSNEEFEIINLLSHTSCSLGENDLVRIHEKYRTIHTAYTAHESVEDLKRAVFIQWYATTEPSYLSGIDSLDHNDEIRNMKRLHDLIQSDTLDAEFTMMLDYYYRITDWYFDGFENTDTLKAFFRRDQPTLAVKIKSVNRGQMGLYWSSLNL